MFYYNYKTCQRELHFLSPPKRKLEKDRSYRLFIPTFATTDSKEETIPLLSLTSKIVLGSCTWLWGNDFLRTTQAANMRKGMRKIDLNVLKMTWKEYERFKDDA